MLAVRNRIVVLGLIFASVGLSGCKLGCVENVDNTLQHGWQGIFDVRIQRIPESCATFAAVAGANYVISSRRGTFEDWKQIASIHYDDPIDIPNDAVVIVSEYVAFAFLVDKYVITTDSGDTWSIWGVQTDLPDWKRPSDQYFNWAKIDRVEMKQDGSGTMFLKRPTDRNGGAIGLIQQLRTSDFGKTWVPQY